MDNDIQIMLQNTNQYADDRDRGLYKTKTRWKPKDNTMHCGYFSQ